MKKLAVFLMAICLPISAFAEFADKPRFLPMSGGTRSQAYVDMESIRHHPNNPKLLVYDMVTNFDDTVSEVAGTSVIEKHYLDCLNRIDISNPEPMKVYSSPFGKGELLHDIPSESNRFEMKEISPISILSAFVCEVGGRDFGGNPNAFEDMKKELDKMTKQKGRKR